MGRLGLSILPGFHRGMRGMGNVKAGSQVAVGFKYSTGSVLSDPPDIEDLIPTVIGCTYATGAFANVSAEVSRGIISNYLTVKVVPSIDFSQAEDIGGLIEGKLRECYPDFGALISSRDATSVFAVPQDPKLPAANVQLPPGSPGGPPAKTPSIIDSLSSSLGLGTGSTGSSSSLTRLIIPIGLAVLVAKAFK